MKIEFIIKNNNYRKKSRVVLFGCNMRLLDKNFGSDIGVDVSVFRGNYLDTLQKSAQKPLKVHSFLLETTNGKQSENKLFANEIDANGYCSRYPIVLKNNKEVDALVTINGNVDLFFDIEPNCRMTLILDCEDKQNYFGGNVFGLKTEEKTKKADRRLLRFLRK